MNSELASHGKVYWFSWWNEKNRRNTYENFCKIVQIQKKTRNEIYLKFICPKNDLEYDNREELQSTVTARPAGAMVKQEGQVHGSVAVLPQISAVIDNLGGSVLVRCGCLILLLNQNTVEIILGKYCLHPTLTSQQVVLWCRSASLLQ